MDTAPPLTGRVALVAGATRGAGRAFAVEVARAGAHVYATGRSSRVGGRSEMDRPETIEETGELIAASGGSGTALVVDHEDPDAVRELVARIDEEHGRLDILVNDIFGGDRYAEWERPLWEHDLDGGLRMLRMGVDTHLITAHHALPLMLRRPGGAGDALLVEVTDGTDEFNAEFRDGVGFYYDLVKANVSRIVLGLSHELRDHPVTALGVTPGWLRSEKMLEGSASPRTTGATASPGSPGSPSPSHRPTSAVASPRSRLIWTTHGSQGACSPLASWPSPTTSPTQTARVPTAGATSPGTASASSREPASRSTADLRRP